MHEHSKIRLIINNLPSWIVINDMYNLLKHFHSIIFDFIGFFFLRFNL